MFSNCRVERFDDRAPEFRQDLAQNPRVQQIRGKIRTPRFEGKPTPEAAALGLHGRVPASLTAVPPPDTQAITVAFWGACHGDQQYIAEQLLELGADLNWVGRDQLTPLDAAIRGHANRLTGWLRGKGACTAAALSGRDAGESGQPEPDAPE